MNQALRPLIADAVGTLQSGTPNSTAPLLNTEVSTEAWLHRFDIDPDRIYGYWEALHKMPKLPPSP
ncbi:hypothetical protein X942_3991 [Burkholderia pseudomallei MSHR5596]|nr:hypothetical protein X942_3991 [Burkholderia pseudomallei MSHR5596]